MILIIGGAYQGKLDYALKRFSLQEKDLHRCKETDAVMPQGKRLIYGLEQWILALLDAGRDPLEEITLFITRNAQAIVIVCDISSGIVPADPRLRLWREAVGRCLGELSASSEEVVRLFCGIATRIK